ncbi:MAG: amidohydrolase family protein [Pyrinomonadaceae bacterium]|nr:amidohydrolase family protein [Pyrinomonadaceae bacterium]
MTKKKSWKQQCDIEGEDQKTPVPTQIVSNEEFVPFGQTEEQAEVEHRLGRIADDASKRLNMSRRRFLASTGGMAAAFLAMNCVYGKRFDVDENEVFEPGATDEKLPKTPFIFDIHTHHVETGKVVDLPLLGYRSAGAAWGNKDLVDKKHIWEDLYLTNYVKEMFLDSDTSMAVITGLPAKEEKNNVLPPAEIIESRTRINGLADSKRIVAHGLFSPDLGKTDLEDMKRQHEQLKVDAWKGYPGQPIADGSVGWWMDDEKVAYPAYEYSRKIGVKNICVHKGLPLPSWDLEHSSTKDIPKAAKDFRDLNFLIYHAGFKGGRDVFQAASAGFKEKTRIPWVSDLCAARKKDPEMTNVYMDLGTTFGMTVITSPLLCTYLLGEMIDAFGEDHVLWGTDSIWWGSPQWQIDAFKRLKMPDRFVEKFGFKPLTDKIKEKILGLNSAKVYGIDVKAKLKAIPKDYVTRLKKEYEASGGRPSNTRYGWVRA